MEKKLWQVASGKWQVASGKWQVASGKWQDFCNWLFFVKQNIACFFPKIEYGDSFFIVYDADKAYVTNQKQMVIPPANSKVKYKKGFTLIEISIVLVIIGLLAGGILAGRDLIKAAEIRSVISDIDKFRNAFTTFKSKYNCMAGDCLNATDYFGSSTCTNPTNSGTCNGNGDGIMDIQLAIPSEPFRAWQHLSMAGLIEGKYTGIAIPPWVGKLGANMIPESKISNTGYDISGTSGGWTITNFFANGVDNKSKFIMHNKFDGTDSILPVFTVSEAMAIDTKFDDGNPAHGNIRTFMYGGCSTTIVPETAQYKTANANSVFCNLLFSLP